jgi:SAM-dependent methyltransferase
MDRFDRLRQHIDVANGRGLEIGPLASPVVPRTLGDVYYVDHLATDDLVAKYTGDPKVDERSIVSTDFVWGSNTLAEAVGDLAPFDYVVASHVLEHVPDLVGWLDEVAAVLRPGGRLSLAMPDRRYTFDVRRGTPMCQRSWRRLCCTSAARPCAPPSIISIGSSSLI